MQLEKCGILILNKPAEWTSFDVIAKARGILETRKLGHAGTLDPMATGVLPIFIGRATKAIDMQIIKDKEYIATFKLGFNTDTGDITGKVIQQRDVCVGLEQVVKELENFKGEIKQYPPMYSAVKVNGQPLYKFARKGIKVDRKERIAIIKEIEMLENNEKDSEYTVRVLCGEGTYIRTLVEDIGENLGCGAVLTKLIRTKACGYSIGQSITLQQLQEEKDNGNLQNLITEVDSVFKHLERIDLSDELALRTANGAKSRISKPDGVYRAYYKKQFYAIVKVEEKKLSLLKLFIDRES